MFVQRPFRFSLSPVPRSTKGLFTGYVAIGIIIIVLLLVLFGRVGVFILVFVLRVFLSRVAGCSQSPIYP